MNDRIPPATSLDFEILANKVCDEAKVDREDRHSVAYELQTHLEETCRDGYRLGLNEQEAKTRAIQTFGTIGAVARSLRKSFLHRLVFHESTRPLRIFITIVFFLLLGSVGEYIEIDLKHAHDDWHIPNHSIGRVVGVLALFYFVARFGLKLSQKSQSFSICRKILILGLLIMNLETLQMFAYPAVVIPYMLRNHDWTKADLNFDLATVMFIILIQIPLGILAFLSIIAEIFDWPRLKREGNSLLTSLFYRKQI
jgi:hypothetical protein